MNNNNSNNNIFEPKDNLQAEHWAIARYDAEELSRVLSKKASPVLDDSSWEKLADALGKIKFKQVKFYEYVSQIENYDGNKRYQNLFRTFNEKLVIIAMGSAPLFDYMSAYDFFEPVTKELFQKNILSEYAIVQDNIAKLCDKGWIKLDEKFFLGKSNHNLQPYLYYGLHNNRLEMSDEHVTEMIKEIGMTLHPKNLQTVYEQYVHLAQVSLQEIISISGYYPVGNQAPERFNLMIQTHPASIDTYVKITEKWFKGGSVNQYANLLALSQHLNRQGRLTEYIQSIDEKLLALEASEGPAVFFRQYYDKIHLYNKLDKYVEPQSSVSENPEIRKLKI